jgi:hypothetical protein
MKTLQLLYDETICNEIAEKILTKTKEKIKEQIADELYTEISGYFYEHYLNNKDKIKGELLKEISDEYVDNPENYQFRELRKKIFEENKDIIVGSLTNHAILHNMEIILKSYTSEGYTFHWMWKDGIVTLIRDNWDLFKDDERIVSGLGRVIENLKYKNQQLQERLNIITETLNELKNE